jgi:hypothetical protein
MSLKLHTQFQRHFVQPLNLVLGNIALRAILMGITVLVSITVLADAPFQWTSADASTRFFLCSLDAPPLASSTDINYRITITHSFGSTYSISVADGKNPELRAISFRGKSFQSPAEKTVSINLDVQTLERFHNSIEATGIFEVAPSRERSKSDGTNVIFEVRSGDDYLGFATNDSESVLFDIVHHFVNLCKGMCDLSVIKNYYGGSNWQKCTNILREEFLECLLGDDHTSCLT